ncbi:hypothetical protein [uncultured Shewanella sp.]|uniref:hypothetical protein n=1 Tax=uncultured Shewanella sp. TaxID=173975 RepID=UPI00260B7700|nr:hypothetical protein [uncultured Shewanella sp.]
MSGPDVELARARGDEAPLLSFLQRRFAGVFRFWFYDVGSASFMGVALLGLVMLAPVIAFSKPEVLPLMLGMIQVSVSAAVAWQLNRLAATEWSILIPEYRNNMLFQCGFMLLSAFVTGSVVSFVTGIYGAFTQLLLATGLGLSFIYLCQIKQSTYYLSIFLYLSLLLMESVSALLSEFMVFALVLLILMLVRVIYKRVTVSPWHPDARSIYLNALEMGGIWLPTAKSYRFITKLEQSLHPVSFFMGPLLAILIVAMPLFTLTIAVLSQLTGVEIPVLFLLAQFSCVTCAMVHWSRIQRWRAVEALYMLPGFSGKQGMIDAFNRSQFKLSLLLTLIMAVTASLVFFINPAVTLSIWLHFVMATLFGCGFILGAGSLCKSALQLSMTMLIIICHSAWVSAGLRLITEGSDVIPWLAGDLIFTGVAMLTLWYGSKKLWRGDLV